MDALVFSLIFASIGFAIAILASRADKRILMTSALLFAVYLGGDDLVTGLPTITNSLDFIPGNWNWSGKVLSLALSAIVVLLLRLSPDAIGLRKQEHPKIAWAGLGFFIVWGICLGLAFKPGVPDAETLAFQATMPGLAEEIAYRGIAPAILLTLMNRKPHVDGIPWVVILATSVMFGLWHSLSFSDGNIGFDLMSGLFPFIGSIPGGWFRFKTKSLLVPILGHGLANVSFHVAGGFRS
jgi:membrane protease YdiL (CAAX protease family)